MIYTIRVETQGIAQPRAKARRFGNVIQIYTPTSERISTYKALFKDKWNENHPETMLEGPLTVHMAFYMRRTSTELRRDASDTAVPHTKKPDIDNLAKAVLDALNGVAWHDDSQIYQLHIIKYYGNVEFGGATGKKRISGEPFVTVGIQTALARDEEGADV